MQLFFKLSNKFLKLPQITVYCKDRMFPSELKIFLFNSRIASTVFATLFCGRNFITNPFDQNFALKWSECHQNIQHHPSGTRPGVDSLRD